MHDNNIILLISCFAYVWHDEEKIVLLDRCLEFFMMMFAWGQAKFKCGNLWYCLFYIDYYSPISYIFFTKSIKLSVNMLLFGKNRKETLGIEEQIKKRRKVQKSWQLTLVHAMNSKEFMPWSFPAQRGLS